MHAKLETGSDGIMKLVTAIMFSVMLICFACYRWEPALKKFENWEPTLPCASACEM